MQRLPQEMTQITYPNRDSGAVLAEFALLIGLVFLMLAGTFDAAWLIRQYDIAEQATRHAARSGVAVPISCTPGILFNNNCDNLDGLSVPLGQAAEAGCRYLELSKLNRAEWEVQGSIQSISPNANYVNINETVLQIEMESIEQSCLFCLQALFSNLRPRAQSSFMQLSCPGGS